MRRILPFSFRRRISRSCMCISCVALGVALCISICMHIAHWWHCATTTAIAAATNPAQFPHQEPSSGADEQIDVVYTWVNGSEPRFLANLRRYASERHASDQHLDATRYDDKDELLFSLRSLHAHAWPWLRTVHVVTNGQLPFWLDVHNDRVRVHTHAELVTRDAAAEEQMLLPTFSSAAIETLLHLVPNLSQRFLYLNDDVFLGREAYLSELWTRGGGVRVFRAWQLPDCAAECPWTYVADGACDAACNRAECQWDGGDCRGGESGDASSTEEPSSSFFGEQAELVMPKHLAANRTALRDQVDSFNAAQKRKLKLNRARFQPHRSRTNKADATLNAGSTATASPPTVVDLYAASLLHTQRRLNVHHGHRSRRVIAHVGFLLDLTVLRSFHRQFAAEIAVTRANRFRSPTDVQFAFAYFHHLMEAQDERSTAVIFDDFDTDHSGTWSDREIRTLLTRIAPLPLDWAAVRYFEDIVANCSSNRKNGGQEREAAAATLTNEYERYIDSSIPHVSKELVVGCTPLVDVLHSHFGRRPRFRHTVDTITASAAKPFRAAHANSHFKMLTSNVTQVIEALDELRQAPRLFACINDNRQLPSALLDDDGDATTTASHELVEANALIVALLEDFYVSLFPLRSPFELTDGLRNRFATVHEWKLWQRQRTQHQSWLLMAVLLALAALVAARLVWWMWPWRGGGSGRHRTSGRRSRSRTSSHTTCCAEQDDAEEEEEENGELHGDEDETDEDDYDDVDTSRRLQSV